MPVILVFFGLTASGKSFLAKAFARKVGAVYFNSDVLRKEIANLPATKSQPEGIKRGIYSQAMTDKVYAAMLKEAKKNVRQGVEYIILDASYGDSTKREQVADFSVSMGCKVLFLYCFCSEQETKKRLSLRAQDPSAVSDGRLEVYQQQVMTFDPPEQKTGNSLIRLDTEKKISDLLEQLNILLQNHPR